MNSHYNSELVRKFYDVSHKILLHAKDAIKKKDFLHDFYRMFCETAECDFSEFWFKMGDRQYYSHYNCESDSPFIFDTFPGNQNFADRYIENKRFARLCKDILEGNVVKSTPNYTQHGSFFANNVRADFPELDFVYINQNNGLRCDFNSIGIIPIDGEKKKGGLLLLLSSEAEYFSLEQIELFENITENFVIALDYMDTQFRCRERVKELTCLYGISKISEKHNLSLDVMLKRIVKLLPPSWQYPEIASARIVLDGKYYTTPDFSLSKIKKSSDIVINNQQRGFVELTYPEDEFEEGEEPFLKEEQPLMNLIARQIAHIVEKKEAEKEKEKLHRQLRHADRLATIGQLSAGVAHELNEPLLNILGFAQLIQEDGDLKEQADRDIAKIITESMHAREVVRKLMLFSRQMPPQKKKVDLNGVVEKGLYFLESRCQKHGIDLTRWLSDDPLEVVADPSQLHQVLVNLVVNAIQAMPDGGELIITTKASDDSAVLIVEDTGMGMTEEIQKQIFIPFFTTKDVNEGTGLGLPVVHGIITSHNGKIHVESQPGKGTTFEVTLPLAK